MSVESILNEFKKKFLFSDWFNVCVIFLFSGLLFGLPILQTNMTWRTDAYFHLSRIFDMSSYLREFKTPLIVNLHSFADVGQSINGMYPFLSIAPLVFITSHFSPIHQYFTINWLFILSGSILNYFVFQKFGASKLRALTAVSLISSFINVFAFSSLSLHGVWSIYFMFPLAVLSISRLKNNNWWYVLTLSMSLSFMLNTHLLSALLSVLLLSFYYVYIFFKSENKPKVITKTVVSLIIFVILSLSTLTNLLIISKDSLTSLETFQLSAGTVNIEQMIHSLTNPPIFGVSVPSLFGSLLILDLIFLIFWKRLNKKTHVIFLLSLTLQIIVSPYFPWALLQKTPVSTIQFPSRFVPLILIILVIGLATDNFFDNTKLIIAINIFSCLLAISFQTSNASAKIRFPFFPPQINSYDHAEPNLLNYREHTLLTRDDLKNPTFYRLKSYPEYVPKNANKHHNLYSDSVNNHTVLNDKKEIPNVSVYTAGNIVNYAFKDEVTGNVDLPLWKYSGVNYSVLNHPDDQIKVSKRHTVRLKTQKTKLIQIKVTNPRVVNEFFWISIYSWVILLIAILTKIIYFKTPNTKKYKH